MVVRSQVILRYGESARYVRLTHLPNFLKLPL